MGYFAERWRECRVAPQRKDIIVTWLCVFSARLSPATWVGFNSTTTGKALQFYAAGSLVVLWLMLAFGPTSGAWACLIIAAGAYRLQDLIFASLDNVFGLTERGEAWKRDLPGAAPVLINLVNIVTVIVIFAIWYQNWPGAGSAGFSGTNLDALPGHLGFGFLYLSWTTLFPPGSGFTPTHTTTRWLFMAESVSGLLVIGLTLAALLSRSDKSTQASAQQPPGSPVPRRAIGIGEVRDMAIIIVCAIVIGVIAGFTCGILVGLLTSG